MKVSCSSRVRLVPTNSSNPGIALWKGIHFFVFETVPPVRVTGHGTVSAWHPISRRRAQTTNTTYYTATDPLFTCHQPAYYNQHRIFQPAIHRANSPHATPTHHNTHHSQRAEETLSARPWNGANLRTRHPSSCLSRRCVSLCCSLHARGTATCTEPVVYIVLTGASQAKDHMTRTTKATLTKAPLFAPRTPTTLFPSHPRTYCLYHPRVQDERYCRLYISLPRQQPEIR